MSVAAVGGAAGVAAAVVVPVLVLGVVVAPVPSDAPGISEQQLKVWRETFERKVAELVLRLHQQRSNRVGKAP